PIAQRAEGPLVVDRVGAEEGEAWRRVGPLQEAEGLKGRVGRPASRGVPFVVERHGSQRLRERRKKARRIAGPFGGDPGHAASTAASTERRATAARISGSRLPAAIARIASVRAVGRLRASPPIPPNSSELRSRSRRA